MKPTVLFFALLMSACSVMSDRGKVVTLPICLYQPITDDEWTTFQKSLDEAISFYFGSETDYLLPPSRRSLSVSGSMQAQTNFVKWLSFEGCLPKYHDSQERGQYAVCTRFMENAGNKIIDRAFSDGESSPEALMSAVIDEMDQSRLLCHRDW